MITLKEVKEQLTYDNDTNEKMLSLLCEDPAITEHWSEDDKLMLQIMLARCTCIMAFALDWMNFDITELDCKRYLLDEEGYSGAPFLFDDYGEKWEDIFRAARAGDVRSCMFLADKLSEGYFSEAMKVHASEFWRIAATQGEPTGMYNYGMCFRWGECGAWADPDQAMEWFHKAADAGHEKSAELIRNYDSEEGKSILLQSAISGAEGYGTKWYKSRTMVEEYFEGADAGDAEMQYELARQSVPGEKFDAFSRKPENAVKYYTMAAESGMLDAMFNLANLYETGCPGMSADIAKAFAWRKRCADAGDAEAMYLLAKMYRDGEGTGTNDELFRRYLEKSAAEGFSKAAKLLENGL